MSLRKKSIYLAALLMDMSTSSTTLGVTAFASKLGASSSVIGAMASVYRLLYVIFCQIFGKLSDRIGRKRINQMACLSFSLLYMIIPFCRGLRQLAMLFPLTGVILSAVWPAMEAWVGEHGDRRTLLKRVRTFNLSWTAGLLIGYFSSGYIHNLHVFAPLYLASAGSFCAAIALTIQPSPDGMSERQEDVSPQPEPADPKLVTKYLYISWVAVFTSYLTLGIMRYIFQKLLYDMGMEPSVFGRLMVCQTGAQFLMFFILGATERWHFKFAPLMAFQVLSSLGFVAVWLTNSLELWVFGLVLIGLNTGMTYFSSIYYSLCRETGLGNKAGWHETIIHSGVLSSTIIGGLLADHVGLKAPYIFCAAAMIIGLPVQLFILRRRRS